jgi:aspartyl-tRNA synthetase
MAAPFLSELKRTHSCGELRASDVGREVILMGWVQYRRDHGNAVFIDLRDRAGLTQVKFAPDIDEGAHALAGELRLEFCIGVRGKVVSRGSNVNPKLATGEIEVEVHQLQIFSRAETPPFVIEDNTQTGENVRLKYRYLDLRRPSLQQNFIRRSQLYQTVRTYLAGHGFLEIETPFMVKYTPGGARNFLVPSRLNPGKFYALAESPQIFKQLFMVSGLDRYFQIVRCFRDEDLREDRQPEFTQIDIEMSFVTADDVFRLVEGMAAALWRDVLGVEVATPFPRMRYEEAMRRFGSDKPDTRFGLELCDLTEAARAAAGGGVPLFESALAGGGIVKALRLPAEFAQKMSRTEADKLEEFVKGMGAKGLARARVGAGGAWSQTPLKTISDRFRAEVNQLVGAGEGDLVFFQFGSPKLVNTVLGRLRLHLGEKLSLIPQGQWKFLWVTDFPLFERSEDGTLVAAHHPFTSPKPEELELLESDPARVHAQAYDLVLNGNEIAGGSIRIHEREVQARVFRAIGLSEEEARAKFGFLLDAFRYGPPPHGGIAAGVDRLTMLLCGADSLRDVIAFPKTQKGTDLMTDCPTEVSKRQLDELFIDLKGAGSPPTGSTKT